MSTLHQATQRDVGPWSAPYSSDDKTPPLATGLLMALCLVGICASALGVVVSAGVLIKLIVKLM